MSEAMKPFLFPIQVGLVSKNMSESQLICFKGLFQMGLKKVSFLSPLFHLTPVFQRLTRIHLFLLKLCRTFKVSKLWYKDRINVDDLMSRLFQIFLALFHFSLVEVLPDPQSYW